MPGLNPRTLKIEAVLSFCLLFVLLRDTSLFSARTHAQTPRAGCFDLGVRERGRGYSARITLRRCGRRSCFLE